MFEAISFVCRFITLYAQKMLTSTTKIQKITVNSTVTEVHCSSEITQLARSQVTSYWL